MKTVVIALCSFLVLTFGGCQQAASTKAFNVHVNVDPGVTRAFTMDLIPLGAADHELRGISAGRHFNVNNPGPRQDALNRPGMQGQTRTFRSDESGNFTIFNARDELWKTWRRNNVMDLLVVIDRFAIEAAGDADREAVTVPDERKRLIIPLDRRRWTGRDNDITIHVQRANMTFQPQPKPAN